MSNIREFYIFAQPVKTDIGHIDFIKVKDFPLLFNDLQVMSMGKWEIIHRYRDANKDRSLDDFIKRLEGQSLYEIVTDMQSFLFSYQNVFNYVFRDETSIEHIDEGNFESIRRLILDMNNVIEPASSPVYEVHKALERSRRVKNLEGSKVSLDDMFTSIVVATGVSYLEIQEEWTVYQFFATYYRVRQFKEFDVSTLFATVSEKAKVKAWNEHIDMFESESHSMTESEFQKQVGGIFSD